MAQYLLAVHTSAEDAEIPDDEVQRLYASVDRFNQRLQAEGVWVFAGGLAPIETATTVDNTGGESIVTDGPFAESKEWLGGFWIVEAPDLDAALKWAAEGSAACQGRVEVRPFESE